MLIIFDKVQKDTPHAHARCGMAEDGRPYLRLYLIAGVPLIMLVAWSMDRIDRIALSWGIALAHLTPLAPFPPCLLLVLMQGFVATGNCCKLGCLSSYSGFLVSHILDASMPCALWR